MKSTDRPSLALAAHHGEDPLREIGRQRRGDLVKEQQLRVAGERAREVDHPQERQRHVGHELAEVDVELHRLELAADRA